MLLCSHANLSSGVHGYCSSHCCLPVDLCIFAANDKFAGAFCVVFRLCSELLATVHLYMVEGQASVAEV